MMAGASAVPRSSSVMAKGPRVSNHLAGGCGNREIIERSWESHMLSSRFSSHTSCEITKVPVMFLLL
jgi:hypothetical protein